VAIYHSQLWHLEIAMSNGAYGGVHFNLAAGLALDADDRYHVQLPHHELVLLMQDT
jgi:hypothetical protein